MNSLKKKYYSGSKFKKSISKKTLDVVNPSNLKILGLVYLFIWGCDGLTVEISIEACDGMLVVFPNRFLTRSFSMSLQLQRNSLVVQPTDAYM